MDDIISNMGETVFAVGIVFFLLLFGFLTAVVRSSQAKEHLKKHPIKKCPFCAEMVLLEAKVCKHCGRDFAPVSSQPEVQRPAKDSTIEEYERWKKSQQL
jgi:ribosomal protein L37AE/L43A